MNKTMKINFHSLNSFSLLLINHSPAKSGMFGSAPSSNNFLTNSSSPLIAALCKGVSPRPLQLRDLGLCGLDSLTDPEFPGKKKKLI